MKNKWGIALLAIVLVGGGYAIGGAMNSSAATAGTPGSASDPVVTKSYVDQRLADSGGAGGGAAAELAVVSVPWGSKVIVQAGGELIVRSGKALAVSADSNGLSDLTDGLDIAPGKPIANNHLILFPRAGRGVEPDPKQKNGIIVLIRGTYEMK